MPAKVFHFYRVSFVHISIKNGFIFRFKQLVLMIVITLAHLVSNANATSGSILIIGDSLSAEYGIQSNTGWVSYIQEYLNEYNKPYKITNVSISGETTSGGLSRLGKALERYSPEIVVIELGSNDALRGLPLDMTKKN